MQVKFFAFFAILGFLISFLCGLAAGNKVLYVLTVSMVSGLGLGIIGFIANIFLEKNIPELFDSMELSSNSDNLDDNDTPTTGSTRIKPSSYSSNAASLKDSGTGIELKNFSDDSSSSSQSTSIPKSNPSSSKKGGNFGDHIVVDNVTIKNEPKLMAEAIRTIMASEDEG